MRFIVRLIFRACYEPVLLIAFVDVSLDGCS